MLMMVPNQFNQDKQGMLLVQVLEASQGDLNNGLVNLASQGQEDLKQGQSRPRLC